MRTVIWLICFAMLVTTGGTVTAAAPHKGKQKKFTPPPTPTPPGAPSADLSKFISSNLDKILGTLDAKVPLPRAELDQMRASFSARFSKASLAERGQFQAALAVCDALSKAMAERSQAAVNPAAANWTVRSAQIRANIDELVAREKAAETGAPAPAR